jgi:UDP-N-acetylmuramate dehydrogenase
MNLFDDCRDICKTGVPLGPLTWFKLGGPAEYFLEPTSEKQLARIVTRCRETDTPLRYLGMGANVLVPDEGVKGAVVRLTHEAFADFKFDGTYLVAGGGADLTKLVLAAVRQGLAGLEHIAGIPGTVGGGICMNCGGKYGELDSAVVSVRTIASDGEICERDHDDLGFAYRTCRLGQDCVVSARFKLRKTDPAELDRRFREIWMYKQNTQPPLGAASIGCIFRNPEGQSAGQLIDRAGLKGLRLGSAYVSDRHANFVIADRGGLSADVRGLISLIQERVEQHCGLRLEPEVKIW